LRPIQKAQLKSTLVELLSDGSIEKTERRRFRVKGQLPPVLVVQFHKLDIDGELLARPKDSDINAPVIRLAPNEANSGANIVGVGDFALVRLSSHEDGYEARVIKKLDRDQGPVLGVINKDRVQWRIDSISRKSRTSYLLRKEDQAKVKAGDLVRVSPMSGRSDGLRRAKLIEHIGSMDQAKAASLLTLAEHGIKEGFTAEEELQANKAKAPTLKNRTDLRDLPLITIDPDDARDFDDAVYAKPDTSKNNADGWLIYVAIADVAAFVTPGSALDDGARKRGNSVYLPDRVVPMLPERLSADLCSLRPLEDRACLMVRMVLDKNGNKLSHKFFRGIMHSKARLTYTQAQNAIDGNADKIAAPVLKSVLQPLWSAYQALQIARNKRQPLQIETDERKIRVGDNGEITSIDKKQRLNAHRLIEEFMVLANVCAAQTLENDKKPLIYRVHETPDQAKILGLAEFLRGIGLKWSKGQKPTPERFNQLLSQASNTDMQQMVNQMVLRSQMRAIYDTANRGHFGLALDQYAHFTSPIRRYADLTVHRGLISACNLGDDGSDGKEQSELKSIAEHITATERTAMAAERDAASRYVAAFLAERIQATFTAKISGVTRFGVFVTLDETGADGLIPIRSLGNEYFNHDEAAHTLVGRDSGGRYRLGMAVELRLIESNPITGGLIFEMLSKPEPGLKPKRNSNRHGSRKQKSNKKFKRKKR
jgi:ribonuclease R